jgi:hypothetical protein
LLFLSYFQNRDDIREATWGNAPWETRVKRAAAIITDFGWFDPDNPKQLAALDERLNQGKFAGLSAQRIESGQVDFLHGTSVREGLLALVPRALWEGKPVFAGSSVLIREMTGLEVNENTTFGVGQVMEFYINFGIPSLVLGFIVFGFAYGWIDWKVAEALQRKDFDRALFWFLPGAAMLAPLASIAETMGNLAAALVAALGLRYAWSVLWRVRSERVAVQLHAQDPKQTDTSQTSNSDGQLQATRP